MGFTDRAARLASPVVALLVVAGAFGFAACDDPPSDEADESTVESRIDAIRQKAKSFRDDNRAAIEAHSADTGLELSPPPSR